MIRTGNCIRLAASLSLVLGAAGAAAATAEGPVKTVDQALQLELTPDGLSAVAGLVKDLGLGNLQNMPLPDIAQSLPIVGIDLALSGVKASAHVDSVALTPEGSSLRLRVGIHDLTVGINSLRVERPILGLHPGTTCSDTQFHLAEQGIVYFDMELTPSVKKTQIALAANAVNINISSDNYRVSGPATCTDLFGGYLTSFAMHEALELVRPFLEGVVRDKVKALMPVVAEQLNTQTHVSAILNVAGLPSLPVRTAQLDAFPSHLKVSKDGMKVQLGVSIREIDFKTLDREELESRVGPVRYGSIGFNPTVVTAAFQALWPEGGDWFDISEQAQQFLDVESMSSIWPDLLQLPLTDPHLHAQARIIAPPELGVDPQTQSLTAHLPKVEIRFQVSLNGQYQDYFFMTVDLTSGAHSDITSDVLSIGIVEHSQVKVGGHWADGYQPTTETFDSSMAEAILTSLTDLLYATNPIFQTELPIIDLGNLHMALATPHVDAPFYSIDMMGR